MYRTLVDSYPKLGLSIIAAAAFFSFLVLEKF
jgi:hypothetical protein